MDKNSKEILNYLISQGGCENPTDFNDGLDELSSAMNIPTQTLLANIRFLHDSGYVDYQYYANTDRAAAFVLSHKGLHWKHFRKKEILDYIADKWIDFFAFIVSILSLILSIVALLQNYINC